PSSVSPFLLTATPPPDLYTLSLHDALPISRIGGPAAHPEDFPRDSGRIGGNPRSRFQRPFRSGGRDRGRGGRPDGRGGHPDRLEDRKSTRLNSSHLVISYAVFCLKKKKR